MDGWRNKGLDRCTDECVGNSYPLSNQIGSLSPLRWYPCANILANEISHYSVMAIISAHPKGGNFIVFPPDDTHICKDGSWIIKSAQAMKLCLQGQSRPSLRRQLLPHVQRKFLMFLMPPTSLPCHFVAISEKLVLVGVPRHETETYVNQLVQHSLLLLSYLTPSQHTT